MLGALRNRQGSVHQAFAALLLLALALRGLVPAGYMLSPGHNGAGYPTVQLCTADAANLRIIEAALNAKFVKDEPTRNHGEREKQSSPQHGHCVLAGASELLASVSAVDVPTPDHVPVVATADTTTLRAENITARQRRATGPPLTV